MRQFGLYPSRAQEHCGAPSLVREDRDGRTSGVPAVPPGAAPGSHVRMGEPLKASKRETLPKTSAPRGQPLRRAVRDQDVDRRQVQGGQPLQPSRTNRPRGLASSQRLHASAFIPRRLAPTSQALGFGLWALGFGPAPPVHSYALSDISYCRLQGRHEGPGSQPNAPCPTPKIGR